MQNVTFSVCVTFYTYYNVTEYLPLAMNGVGSFLGLQAHSSRVLNVSNTCSVPLASAPPVPAALLAPQPHGRRALAAPPPPHPPGRGNGTLSNISCAVASLRNLTGGCQVINASVTMSITLTTATSNPVSLATALSSLTADSSLSASLLVRALNNAGLNASAAVVAGSSYAAPPSPPLRVSQSQFSNNSVFTAAVHSHAPVITPGEEAAITLAALAVLWLVVHAVVHAVTAAHMRRRHVSFALMLTTAPGTTLTKRSLGLTTVSVDRDSDDDAEGAPVARDVTSDVAHYALSGRRFASPDLSSALHAVLASVSGAPRAQLRPLHRTPLVAHLSTPAPAPTSAAARLMRAVRGELRWQGRELRFVARAVRRCFRKRDDQTGKAFRLVGADQVVLVQCTLRFGWASGARARAAAFRAQLRDDKMLAGVETAVAAAAVAAGPPLPSLGAVTTVCLGLLDDEPHAPLAVGGELLQHAPSGYVLAVDERLLRISALLTKKADV